MSSTEQLKIYAMLSNGERRGPLKVDLNEDLTGQARAAFAQGGVQVDPKQALMLSPTKFDDTGDEVERPETVVLDAAQVASDPTLPPIPKPTGPNDLPPQESEPVLVSSDDVALFVEIPKNHYFPVSGPHVSLSPPFPSPSKLLYKRYWSQQLGRILSGPQQFSHSVSSTEGMSETNTTTLSAELGVEIKGLSAKLSASTSHSITVTSERTVTDEYGVTVPENQTCVYVVWQLVEEFVLADSNNHPITYSGKLTLYNIATVSATFPLNLATNNTNVIASDPTFFDHST